MTPRANPEHGPSIVVGYDGSESARHALVRAGQLARPGGRVAVVSAAPLLVDLGRAAEDGDPSSQHGALLEEAETTLAALGVGIERISTPLEPADALIEAARDLGAEVLVVGTRGRGRAARTALGSVSTAVLRHAGCDVLVVRQDTATVDVDWPRSAIVGYDDSRWARRALERAAEIVRPGGVIHVVFAASPRARRDALEAADTMLQSARDRVTARGIEARARILRDDAAGAVVEEASDCGAELIVVGSRSRGPARRLLLGSVSTAVVHRSEQDVLVVRCLE